MNRGRSCGVLQLIVLLLAFIAPRESSATDIYVSVDGRAQADGSLAKPCGSRWMDEHLLKMRAVGKEKARRFGDSLFVDPASGDFSFRPGSPAWALEIEPLDVSRMGRLDD